MGSRDLSWMNPDGGQLTRTFGLTFVRLNPGMNPDGRYIPLGISAAVRVSSPKISLQLTLSGLDPRRYRCRHNWSLNLEGFIYTSRMNPKESLCR